MHVDLTWNRSIVQHHSQARESALQAANAHSEVTHALLRRDDCNETAVSYSSAADGVTAQVPSPTEAPVSVVVVQNGVPVPIS